jgi:hypothetical protein
MVSPPLNRSVKDWAKIRQRRFFARRKIVEVTGLKGDAGFEKKCERRVEFSPGEQSATDNSPAGGYCSYDALTPMVNRVR